MAAKFKGRAKKSECINLTMLYNYKDNNCENSRFLMVAVSGKLVKKPINVHKYFNEIHVHVYGAKLLAYMISISCSIKLSNLMCML